MFFTSVPWNGAHSKCCVFVGVRIACVKRLETVPNGYIKIVDRQDIYIHVVKYGKGVFAICY